MGTTLVYSAALLLVAAIAAGANDAISTSTTSTLTTPASIIEGNSAPKSKRGVVDTGTNIWANNGAYQSKTANPSTSSSAASYTSGTSHYNSPLISSSPAAQNDGLTSVYTNQKSGYRQASPYSSPSLAANVDGSFGNGGQILLRSPQNYGSADQGLTTSFSFPGALSATSSAQAQNSQAGQTENGPINTPYYANFANAPISLKDFTDKFTTEQTAASLVQIPFQQQNIQKTQSMYAPNHQTAGYFVPSLGSYPYQPSASLSQGSLHGSQGSPVFSASSQIHRNTLKSNSPRQKSQEYVQTYAPHHQSASSFVPNVQHAGFPVPTVDFNGNKIPLPVLQLQSASDFPGFTESINSQPLVIAANNEFGFLADFAKSLNAQGGNGLPFFNQQLNEAQVLPVKSANGSPQFPQYKGARINTAPTYNLAKPGVYEPLNAQPQLHFTAKPASLPPASAPISTSSIIHYPPLKTSRPAAEIRDDVEVIKKKKPVPAPHDFDDDEVDEGYKAIEREYGRQHDDVEDEGPQRGKNFRESDSESDFKPSTSFPFKSYDEKFSKFAKPASSEEDSDEDRPASRYSNPSSADEDEDYDGHYSTHHADYRSPRARPSKYEDAADESQTNERQEEADEDDDHDHRPSAYSSYGKDFEQEFEDSYKRELPVTKYVHVKEVPEIDEPAASSQKSYSTPKSSKSSYTGKKVHHRGEEPEESRSYSTHSSQKHGKAPKTRDGEGYTGSIRSYNKGNSPRVIHEDSFGYKTPEGEGYSKYKKSPSGDSYAAVKKSPKMDSYVKSSRSSYKSPKKDNGFENGDAYSYSSGSSWKSDKKSPESGDYHGHASSPAKSLVQPGSPSGFHAPNSPGGSFFVRDLTGI